jgi:hypothetical protein
MTPYRDYDGTWRISGFEHLEFTTEADARTAAELAIQFASQAAAQEWRYRRVAQKAQENIR